MRKRGILFLLCLLLLGATCPAKNPFFFVNPFTPKSIAGLVMWLDAADSGTLTLSGSNVTQWSDKSGHGNNAVQGTTAQQPTYSATGFNSAKPAVMFSGGQMLIDSTLSSSQPTSIFLVGYITGDNGVGFEAGIDGGNDAARNLVAFSMTAPPALYAGSSFAGTVSSTTPQCLVGVFNGASSQLYQNGSLTASGNVGGQNMNAGCTIGGHNTVDYHWIGPISEIAVYSGSLSASQIGRLHAYARSKWGTP